MKIHTPDLAQAIPATLPSAQDDSFGEMNKSQNNSECSVAKKKIKNKANVKIGKKDASCYMTSRYDNIWVFLSFLWSKNKANFRKDDVKEFSDIFRKVELFSRFICLK